MSELRWKFQRDAARALADRDASEVPAAPSPRTYSTSPRRTPLLVDVAAEQARIDSLCGGGDDGYTYAIRQVGAGLVKIGQATDPVVRIGDIQRMNGGELELVGLCHGAAAESDLHKIHRRHRAHGEWFRLGENPIADGDLGCWNCARDASNLPFVEVMEYPVEVPIRPEREEYNPPATFGRRDGGRWGGWPSAHFMGAAMLCQHRDQAAAARRMFVVSAINSKCYSGAALHLLGRMARALPRLGLGACTTIYFWPGLGHLETSEPSDIATAYRHAVAALEPWEIQASESYLRDTERLP